MRFEPDGEIQRYVRAVRAVRRCDARRTAFRRERERSRCSAGRAQHISRGRDRTLHVAFAGSTLRCLAAGISDSNGSNAPVLMSPACKTTIVGDAEASSRAIPSCASSSTSWLFGGQQHGTVRPKPKSRTAFSMEACTRTLQMTRICGAPATPRVLTDMRWYNGSG